MDLPAFVSILTWGLRDLLLHLRSESTCHQYIKHALQAQTPCHAVDLLVVVNVLSWGLLLILLHVRSELTCGLVVVERCLVRCGSL